MSFCVGAVLPAVNALFVVPYEEKRLLHQRMFFNPYKIKEYAFTDNLFYFKKGNEINLYDDNLNMINYYKYDDNDNDDAYYFDMYLYDFKYIYCYNIFFDLDLNVIKHKNNDDCVYFNDNINFNYIYLKV